MTFIVTKESLLALIDKADFDKRKQIIGRACVALFKEQLKDERETNKTVTTNYKGFTAGDARQGSITAKYFIKNKSLLDWQVELWLKRDVRGTPRIVKYWKQLDRAAKLKQAA